MIASGSAAITIPSLLGSLVQFNASLEVSGNCSSCNICTNGTSCINSTNCVNGTDCQNVTICTNCTTVECPTPPVWTAEGYANVSNGNVLGLPFYSSVFVQFAKYANSSYLQGKFIAYPIIIYENALLFIF